MPPRTKITTPPPTGELPKHKRSRLTDTGRRILNERAARYHGADGKPPPVSRRFDMRGLVALFGGRSTLLWKLRDHGYISTDPEDPMLDVFSRQLSLRGIDAWIQRSSLSADWLQVLMDLHLRTEKFPLPLDEFRLVPLTAEAPAETIKQRKRLDRRQKKAEKKEPPVPRPDYGKPGVKRGPKPKKKPAATTKKKSG